GPDPPDEVVPFLENVLRGRPVPPERLQEVAEHYYRFGGVSPINAQNRALVAALRSELSAAGLDLPLYWGNRNWHPMLAATVEQMRRDGVRRALAWVTSAYASYSGCRQYQDDLARATAAVGPGAPEITKLRPFYNHPGFVEPLADGLRRARSDAGGDAPVLFSAHSIPRVMAKTSAYAAQLTETAGLVAARSGAPEPQWRLVFQSRSGNPAQAWLEPDVLEAIRGLPPGLESVIVSPIGFVSDHMEVVYDLDILAAKAAWERGLQMVRTATPGTDPRFVRMIRELVTEQLDPPGPVRFLGARAPAPGPCPPGCCPAPLQARVSQASGARSAP
ncbi:MAG: ferrochelatase, partial [Acidimicrobiales bacterium]